VKVSLLYFGRPRDRAANQMAQEYARRIGRYCDFQMRQVRDGKALQAQQRAYKVVLDPSGRRFTSAELAGLVAKAENGGLRELVFLLGGADGVGPEARQSAQLLLSLSPMTLPHELARVVLAEQIYRAFTILRHHPYPR